MSICSKQAGRRRDEVDSLALCSPELSRNDKTQSCTNTLHVYLLSREREETEVLNLKSSQQDLCKDQNCLKLPTKGILCKANSRRAEKESAYSDVK